MVRDRLWSKSARTAAVIAAAVLAVVGVSALPGLLADLAGQDPVENPALVRAAARARTAPRLLDPAAEDSVLRAEARLPVGVKVGRWARRFAEADSVRYLFGLSAGGYARDGEIVDDLHVDCVSLLYRCAELARASSADDAVAWALRTRFAGAPLDSVIDATGKADYDRPEHLDFSLDMIRAGHWGQDVTADLAGAVLDRAGSARYPAGSFSFVPSADLDPGQLQEGDVVWFVLEPTQSLRTVQGAVIGHIGIVVVVDGTRLLVHAASKGLPGLYEGGTVVTVPLRVYLDRTTRFCGVMITRWSQEYFLNYQE